MGAGLWIAFVALATVETGIGGCRGRGLPRSGQGSLLLLPGDQIKGEKNDQEEKNPHSPEETAPDSISSFLGVVKNPDGHDQAN